jgi:hypothetical protein
MRVCKLVLLVRLVGCRFRVREIEVGGGTWNAPLDDNGKEPETQTRNWAHTPLLPALASYS